MLVADVSENYTDLVTTVFLLDHRREGVARHGSCTSRARAGDDRRPDLRKALLSPRARPGGRRVSAGRDGSRFSARCPSFPTASRSSASRRPTRESRFTPRRHGRLRRVRRQGADRARPLVAALGLPTAGLTLASVLVVLWVTSSLWYFTTVSSASDGPRLATDPGRRRRRGRDLRRRAGADLRTLGHHGRGRGGRLLLRRDGLPARVRRLSWRRRQGWRRRARALFETGLDATEVAAAVQQGRGVMPAGIVGGQEQADVVAYVVAVSSPSE